MSPAVAIQMKPVESSRISQIGYDPDNFYLFIRFKPTKAEPAGALYRYERVSEELADDFFHAESFGSFFGKHILKNPDYPYLRVASAESAPAAEIATDIPNGTGDRGAKPRPEDDGSDYAQLASSAADLPPVPEDGDGLKLQALEVSNQVRALSIASSDEYLAAGHELLRLRAMKKAAQARVDRIKRPAYETYRASLELEKDVMRPYGEAEDYLNLAMSRYREAEKRERLRVEAELTRERQQAALEDAARKSKEMAMDDAKVAEAQGQPQEVVERIRQQPLPLAPAPISGVVLPREVPKIHGIIERAPVWKWRVEPGKELLVPREYLCINEVAINGVVRSLKGLTKIPGIEVYEEESKVGVRF